MTLADEGSMQREPGVRAADSLVGFATTSQMFDAEACRTEALGGHVACCT